MSESLLIIGEGALADALRTGLTDLENLPYQTVIVCPRWFDEKPFRETNPRDWDAALAANFEEPIFAAQSAAQQMIQRGDGGRIVFLSSVAALKPYADLSAFGASLAALHSVARMAAVDLAAYRITVNVIALGWFEGIWQTGSISNATLAAHIPVGHYGQIEQMIGLVRFLASEAAEYITGAIIPLDGGYSITKAGAATTAH